MRLGEMALEGQPAVKEHRLVVGERIQGLGPAVVVGNNLDAPSLQR